MGSDRSVELRRWVIHNPACGGGGRRLTLWEGTVGGKEGWLVRALADSYAFWILLFFALAVVYLLPTFVGLIRGVDRLALVILVNLIGAPTGIGWVAAMILAFGPRRLRAGQSQRVLSSW